MTDLINLFTENAVPLSIGGGALLLLAWKKRAWLLSLIPSDGTPPDAETETQPDDEEDCWISPTRHYIELYKAMVDAGESEATKAMEASVWPAVGRLVGSNWDIGTSVSDEMISMVIADQKGAKS